MFSQIDALAFRGATFGVGSGPIFLDQVNCIGSEANILQCDMSSPIGAHMCDHTQDAGIRCEGRNYINIICVILKLYQGNFNGATDVRMPTLLPWLDTLFRGSW